MGRTGGTGWHDGTDSRFFEVVGIGSHLTRVTADVSSWVHPFSAL